MLSDTEAAPMGAQTRIASEARANGSNVYLDQSASSRFCHVFGFEPSFPKLSDGSVPLIVMFLSRYILNIFARSSYGMKLMTKCVSYGIVNLNHTSIGVKVSRDQITCVIAVRYNFSFYGPIIPFGSLSMSLVWLSLFHRRQYHFDHFGSSSSAGAGAARAVQMPECHYSVHMEYYRWIESRVLH